MQVRTAQSSRLLSVDALRGLAALVVVFVHLRHDAPGGYRLNPLFFPFFVVDFGYVGVTLFIVLSGFCIHLAVARGMGQGKGIQVRWGPFWKRRFWRLYPPYVAALALSMLVLGLLPAAYPDEALTWSNQTLVNVATHLTMSHNLFQDYAWSLGNGAFWTLGMEEQLYVLYAVYLFLLCRGKRRTAIALALGVALVWRLCQVTVLFGVSAEGLLPLGAWCAWPLGHWFAWVLGALAAECYMGVVQLPRWCFRASVCLAALALGMALNSRTLELIFQSNWFSTRLGLDPHAGSLPLLIRLANETGEMVFALGFFVLVNCWVRGETADGFRGPVSRWLPRLGLISYSLYLTHVPVLRVLDYAFPMGTDIGSAAIRFGLFVPICLLAALGFFLAVERRFLHKKPTPAREPAAAPHGVARPVLPETVRPRVVS